MSSKKTRKKAKTIELRIYRLESAVNFLLSFAFRLPNAVTIVEAIAKESQDNERNQPGTIQA